MTAPGFDSYTLYCNAENDTITAQGHVPVTVLGEAGDDTLITNGSSSQLQHITPNVTFDGGAGLDIVGVNAGGVGNAVVNFTDTQTLSSLTIGSGGEALAVQGSGLVLVTKTITFAGTASSFLDLNDNDMILDYTGATKLLSVNGWINTARNGGAWTGTTGITSSSAKARAQHNTSLGAMEATDYKSIYGANATFDGQAIDNTAVLVKYTYYGDANFNGQVDGGDYARMDLTFGKEATQGNIGGWFNGDFDGDGRVNGGDYALADLAFASQSGVINPPRLLPSSPQPANPPLISLI